MLYCALLLQLSITYFRALPNQKFSGPGPSQRKAIFIRPEPYTNPLNQAQICLIRLNFYKKNPISFDIELRFR